MTKYYTLIAIDHSSRCHIEFGSYQKSDVKAEQQDLKASATFKEDYKSTTILTHNDDYQLTIEADVADFELRFRQLLPKSDPNHL